MDHPSRLFSRIRRQRARTAAPRQGHEPAVAPAPVQPAAPAGPLPAETATRAQARPAGAHSLYSQIMRSHDRMGTRHL